MKKINEFLQKTHEILLDNKSKEETYRAEYEFFNILIGNTDFSSYEYEQMLKNIQNDELKVWIEEVQNACAGCNNEDEANAIKTYKDLAKFYENNPIEY